MVREDVPTSWAAEDFRSILELGRVRGHRLWTAGERQLLARVDVLGVKALELLARLTSRMGCVFHRDDLDRYGPLDVVQALAELQACGVVSTQSTREQRLDAARMPALRKLCRRAGVSSKGRRDQLLARLLPLEVAPELDLVVLRYPSLWLRLERFALGSLHPDRSRWVRSRMGLSRWLEYDLTSGATVFSSRRACLRWEQRVRAQANAHQWLSWMEEPGQSWPPGHLDPRRRWKRAVAEEARELERRGAFTEAVLLYERLARQVSPGSIAVRWARALEGASRPRDALAILEEARSGASLDDRIGIERAGRRLARSLKRAWAPYAPLATASSRRLHRQARDLEAEARLIVEEEVSEVFRAHGLDVVRAEGPWLMMVFALICADLYVLPVSGALPTPFLRAPLDFGTPAFRASRSEEVELLWEEIRAGHAHRIACDAWARLSGVQLSGARWRRFERADVLPWLERLEPGVLIVLLEAVLEEGRSAAAGMPDLLVHAPETVRLDGAHPTRFSAGTTFVEVKGPGDSVRDGQRAWHHRLVCSGARVEVTWVVEDR